MAVAPAAELSAFIDQRPVGRFQILVAVLCGLVVLLDGLDTQVIGYLGPSLAAEWNLAPDALGPVFSAGLVGLMAGLLVIGPLSDAWGRKRAIVGSVALFGAFTWLTAGAQGVGELLIYRFLAGVGLGGAMPNALALTGEYCPRRRRATLTVAMFCGFSLGSILGGGLTAALISSYGWRSIFVAGGVLPLALLPLLAWKLPESLAFLIGRGAGPESAGKEKAAALLRRMDPHYEGPVPRVAHARGVPLARLFGEGRGVSTALLWVVFFLNLMEFYFLQSWMPTVLRASGLAVETAALVTTLISAGGIAAGVLSGPLMDRLGPYRVLAALYAGGAVFVALVGVAPASLAGATASVFAAGFCVSGAQKSVNALAVLFYPAPVRSTGVGWALGVGRLGGILGPLAGGWLLARGWSTAGIFQLAAAPMALAGVFVWAMGMRNR